MFLCKMYKIEQLISYYKKEGYTDAGQLLNLANHHKLTWNNNSCREYLYWMRATLIPYKDMLKLIEYYDNTMMDEAGELFWIEKIGKEYNCPTWLVVQRFNDVSKLSHSLIYKNKLEELINKDEQKLCRVK